METSMFDGKVEKILELSKKLITSNAHYINLFQRMSLCNNEEKSRAVEEVLQLLKSYSTQNFAVRLDLRENDLSIENIQSLALYNGNRIEVDLSSNNFEIYSEEHEKIWMAITSNSQLNLTLGWCQPVRVSGYTKTQRNLESI